MPILILMPTWARDAKAVPSSRTDASRIFLVVYLAFNQDDAPRKGHVSRIYFRGTAKQKGRTFLLERRALSSNLALVNMERPTADSP